MQLTMLALARRFAADHPWLTLATGCITFGVLMGSRTEFEQWWQRALIAGVAFAVLGLTFSLRRSAGAAAEVDCVQAAPVSVRSALRGDRFRAAGLRRNGRGNNRPTPVQRIRARGYDDWGHGGLNP